MVLANFERTCSLAMWKNTLHDVGVLLIRAIIAVVFMYHGSQKLFGMFEGPGIAGFAGFLESINVPLPKVNAVMAASAEVFGGIAVLLGVGLRIAVFPMVVTMVVAIVTVHGKAFSAQAGGMEYPLTLAIVLLGLGLTGAGRFSIDERLRQHFQKQK